MPDQVRDGRRSRCHDHAGLPTEEEDRRNREDEAECHAAGVDSLDRHREALGEGHAAEEPGERCEIGARVLVKGVRHAGRDRRDRAGDADGHYDRPHSGGRGGGRAHCSYALVGLRPLPGSPAEVTRPEVVTQRSSEGHDADDECDEPRVPLQHVVLPQR